MDACTLSCFSHVLLFATLWTVASRLLCPWDSLGKNTGVGCHALFQEIFPNQGLNPRVLHLPVLARRWFTTSAIRKAPKSCGYFTRNQPKKKLKLERLTTPKVGEMWSKQNSQTLLVDLSNDITLLEKMWQFFIKHAYYDPIIPILNIPRINKNICAKQFLQECL